MAEHPAEFLPAEVNFLSEIAVGVGHDGEALVEEDHHAFEQRIIAVPRILARRIENAEVRPHLGDAWGEELLRGHGLRNQLVHPPQAGDMPRITIPELLGIAKAIKQYFSELATIAPRNFGLYEPLLDAFDLPTDDDVNRDMTRMRRFRALHPDRPIMFSQLDVLEGGGNA